MQIKEREVVPVAHREPPLRNSWDVHSEIARSTFIRLTTADGGVRIAETYSDDTIIDVLEHAIELVERTNPFVRNPLVRHLQDPIAYGATDTALGDLIGRYFNDPADNVLGEWVSDEVEFARYLFYNYARSDSDPAAIASGKVADAESNVGCTVCPPNKLRW